MKRYTPKPAANIGKLPSASTKAKEVADAKAQPESQSGQVTFKTPEVRLARNGKKTSVTSPLAGKTYISKSNDNLASVLRRKAVAGACQPRPRSVIGGVSEHEPDSCSASPGSGSPPSSHMKRISVTGASRLQPPITERGAGIKKASSTQNLSKHSSSVKRAASTQNVSREKSGRQRISAPANIMAYNAELLASFEKERKIHEEQISELRQCAETRKTDLEKCRFEIRRLKELLNQSDIVEELAALKNENKLLKDKLIEAGVCVDHITDAEKLSRLEQERLEAKQDSMSGTSDSTSRSKQPNVGSSRAGEDGFDTRSIDSDFALSEPDTPYPTNDQPLDPTWDRHSSKSTDALSEVSVACLQDRILQMEETHYSTNEELQATIQELGDLQNTVNDLSNENERLADEKGVLLESLCAQTEKLEHCRIQIEHLKSLLLNENHTQKSERERQLLEIIKAAQVERDEMLLRQHELSYSLHNSEILNRENQEVIMTLKDDNRLLEDRNECLQREKKATDDQCRELRERLDAEYIEGQKHKSLLETERSKVVELEQYKNASDKTELETLLDNALEEKKKLEAKCTGIQESLAMSRCEILKLKEHIQALEEECKVAKNNAKMSVGDMEYKFRQLIVERDDVKKKSANLRDQIEQLERDCERYLEEKKVFGSQICELKKKIDDHEAEHAKLSREIAESKRRHEEECDDWRQFQSDLQKAVVIANDIKMEAQQDMEEAQSENGLLKDKIHSMSFEINRLRNELESLREENDESGRLDLVRDRVMSSVDREFSIRQQNRKTCPSQQLSVKNLIKTIENQVKHQHVPITSPPGTVERKLSDGIGVSPVSPGYLDLDLSPVSSPCRTPKESQRRGSAPCDSVIHLKPALKKLSVSEEKPTLPVLSRGNTMSATELAMSPPTPTSVAGDNSECTTSTPAPLSSLLSTSYSSEIRRNSCNEQGGKDPLASLVKTSGGSKRNALLKWCQSRTSNYKGIDITNFSSSWNDGLAFCALMHCYLPDQIPYNDLTQQDKRRNFNLAFKAAESVGITSSLSIHDMAAMERPDWQAVMAYVTCVYKHFELGQGTK